MKSRIASFFFLFTAFASGCGPSVIPETQGDLDPGVPACPDLPGEAGEPEDAECSRPVSVAACAVTYPECEPDQPYVRFLTHGSHDCDEPYPPRFCEYVGDVTCDGVTAGVWCCE